MDKRMIMCIVCSQIWDHPDIRTHTHTYTYTRYTHTYTLRVYPQGTNMRSDTRYALQSSVRPSCALLCSGRTPRPRIWKSSSAPSSRRSFLMPRARSCCGFARTKKGALVWNLHRGASCLEGGAATRADLIEVGLTANALCKDNAFRRPWAQGLRDLWLNVRLERSEGQPGSTLRGGQKLATPAHRSQLAAYAGTQTRILRPLS